MREDWGDDTPLEWMWTPQSQGREAGGPAGQKGGPGRQVLLVGRGRAYLHEVAGLGTGPTGGQEASSR